jgi:hypothetical protein
MATSARNWKKSNTFELELPSGNTCLVKRPGMEALLVAGIMPDSLTPIIMDSIKTAQRGMPQDHLGENAKQRNSPNELSAEEMEKFMTKPGALEDIFASFDKVCAMVVVDPPVLYHKKEVVTEDGVVRKDADGRPVLVDIPLSERNEDYLYTDDVDADDKQFIFQYVVGGDDDLDSFRKERAEGMGAVSTGEDVELPPV